MVLHCSSSIESFIRISLGILWGAFQEGVSRGLLIWAFAVHGGGGGGATPRFWTRTTHPNELLAGGPRRGGGARKGGLGGATGGGSRRGNLGGGNGGVNMPHRQVLVDHRLPVTPLPSL